MDEAHSRVAEVRCAQHERAPDVDGYAGACGAEKPHGRCDGGLLARVEIEAMRRLDPRMPCRHFPCGYWLVNPESCTLFGNMAVLHVHGKLDYIIDYDEDWDWKDGEHEGVGTMSDVPGMIDFWAQLSNCEDDNTHSHLFGGDDVEHVVHSDCDGDVRIELYGMEAQEHTWPEQVDGTDTYRLMWNFLSGFTN